MLENEIDIVALSDRDSVRKRTGMYLGSVDNPDVAFREIVDNAIDEVFQSKADTIYVNTDYLDGWRSVSDNGRGIPIVLDNARGITKTELALTKLHAGSKFDKSDNAIS